MTDTTKTDDTKTMGELLEEHGYDPDALVNPRDVHADDIDDDTTVIAYTVVNNPDPDAPATTYELDEWNVEAVIPTSSVGDYTDGSVTYPDQTPVEHGVVWSYRSDELPNFASIGHGDDMYGPDADFDDPNDLERLVVNVRGRSDDYVRFKFN